MRKRNNLELEEDSTSGFILARNGRAASMYLKCRRSDEHCKSKRGLIEKRPLRGPEQVFNAGRVFFESAFRNFRKAVAYVA